MNLLCSALMRLYGVYGFLFAAGYEDLAEILIHGLERGDLHWRSIIKNSGEDNEKKTIDILAFGAS